MNLPIDRDFAAQVVIVLALCAGAWLMLVQSRQAEVTRLEQQLADTAQTSGLASQEGIEALAAKFAASRRRLDVVHRRNAVADDTSSLYATIMRLAAAYDVRVQAMQPTPPRDSVKPLPVRMARLEMTLTGAYDSIARFIDAVSGIDAFIRPSTLELIPIDDDQSRNVSARLGCDVLAFNIDGALTGGGETGDAQP